MRRLRILLVAGELERRARLARELHTSGYAVELASDLKRALTLAAESRFRLAILAPEPGASLPMMQELRDRVDEMLVLEDGSDETARLRGLHPEVDQFQSSDE